MLDWRKASREMCHCRNKPLRELIPKPIRLLYFAHKDRRFIILHAFHKKGKKTPKRHIETAKRRMDEFLEGDE